jgi:hypothetical protein
VNGPGPWGIYPVRGQFFVTREREWGKKDQEVHGSYPTLEIATEISALLTLNETSDRALRAYVEHREHCYHQPSDQGQACEECRVEVQRALAEVPA